MISLLGAWYESAFRNVLDIGNNQAQEFPDAWLLKLELIVFFKLRLAGSEKHFQTVKNLLDAFMGKQPKRA